GEIKLGLGGRPAVTAVTSGSSARDGADDAPAREGRSFHSAEADGEQGIRWVTDLGKERAACGGVGTEASGHGVEDAEVARAITVEVAGVRQQVVRRIAQMPTKQGAAGGKYDAKGDRRLVEDGQVARVVAVKIT